MLSEFSINWEQFIDQTQIEHEEVVGELDRDDKAWFAERIDRKALAKNKFNEWGGEPHPRLARFFADRDIEGKMEDLDFQFERAKIAEDRFGLKDKLFLHDRARLLAEIPENEDEKLLRKNVGNRFKFFRSRLRKRIRDFKNTGQGITWVREYAHKHRTFGGQRQDFQETVYWNALIETDEQGRAKVSFDLSDRVTTWLVQADAHGSGRVGQAESSFQSNLPLEANLKLPIEASAEDEFEAGLIVNLRSKKEETARIVIEKVEGPLAYIGDKSFEIRVKDGQARVALPLLVGRNEGLAALSLRVECGGFIDAVKKQMKIVRRGFPHQVAKSGVLKEGNEIRFGFPSDLREGSLTSDLTFYPSPLAVLQQGMEGMLREPHGCFEQASSSNYPNVLVLSFLDSSGNLEPAIAARARQLLDKGYAKLTGYECSDKGYEWFGSNPGHEALSAYGLLEFHDMKRVYDVDEKMFARTHAWLLGRRDGKGGYKINAQALDSFGRAPQATTQAYVTYALATTGTNKDQLKTELDALEEAALQSKDAYIVALAAGALESAGRKQAADGARERLKTMQKRDGSLQGAASITRSGKKDLSVETTSFAVLAWLQDENDKAAAYEGLRYILSCSNGAGRFGATQATIMAMKALCAVAEAKDDVPEGGQIVVVVNGHELAPIVVAKNAWRPIVVKNFLDLLHAGENEIELIAEGDFEMPWSFSLDYYSDRPADDPGCPLRLDVRTRQLSVQEGETLPIEVTLSNKTGEGLPMAMAIIGLPGHLEISAKVLDALQEAGNIDLWQLNGRNVQLYWRDLAPEQVIQLNLDTQAKIAGLAQGAASRAYLYYTPQSIHWAQPLTIRVK